MQTVELLGSVLGLAFVAGIRLYATILAIGLGLHFELLHLPRQLEGLSILGHPVIIASAAFAYLAEFFADKIPWIDTLWDSFHLLIRPIGAALLALAAVGTLDPLAQVLIVLLCGGVALSTHSTKAGLRFVVNHSPEPFTNAGMSLAEDVFALPMVWLSLVHPLASLGIVAVAMAAIGVIIPRLLRLIRVEGLAIASLARTWFAGAHRASPVALRELVPADVQQRISTDERSGEPLIVRGVAGQGIGVPRNSVGVLLLADGRLVFVAAGRFRRRQWQLPLDRVRGLSLQRRMLFDRLVIDSDRGSAAVHLFKEHGPGGDRLIEAVRASSAFVLR
jgi:uncharacterized protein DUF4126